MPTKKAAQNQELEPLNRIATSLEKIADSLEVMGLNRNNNPAMPLYGAPGCLEKIVMQLDDLTEVIYLAFQVEP